MRFADGVARGRLEIFASDGDEGFGDLAEGMGFAGEFDGDGLAAAGPGGEDGEGAGDFGAGRCGEGGGFALPALRADESEGELCVVREGVADGGGDGDGRWGFEKGAVGPDPAGPAVEVEVGV